MMRSAELRRTGFNRRRKLALAAPIEREKRLSDAAKYAIENALKKPPNLAQVSLSTPAAPVEKENPLRSEAYRRAVASLPCIHCGIEGYSQHAHENDGKGARLKVDDRRAMPLCCSRPGIEGCHVAFDQYRLVPGGRDAHADLGRALAEQTRNRLNALGLWPKGLPLKNFSTGDDFELTRKNRT